MFHFKQTDISDKTSVQNKAPGNTLPRGRDFREYFIAVLPVTNGADHTNGCLFL